jgi:hypothetical protein
MGGTLPQLEPDETMNSYVLLNARRHAAKAGRTLSRACGIDPASSGRWFDGWQNSGSEVLCATRAPTVSRPRSWLLAAGWRRRGLLEPDDIPGRRASCSAETGSQ